MRLSPTVLAVASILALTSCAERDTTAPETFDVPVFSSTGPSDHYHAALSGRDEVPANNEKGRGNSTFKLSNDGTELSYRLIVANVDNVTQAHIHIAPEGVNGPVVAFLFGFVPGGVSENGLLAEGTITQANLIARPAIGFGATMQELVDAIRSGNAYVNVHTVEIPAGQVRGQMK
jgi:hypothetical protein